MREDKIICGRATDIELKELNASIGRENIRGFEAIGIASPTHSGEICVLLNKEKAL